MTATPEEQAAIQAASATAVADVLSGLIAELDFSSTTDVGNRLDGVHAAWDRLRSAGLSDPETTPGA